MQQYFVYILHSELLDKFYIGFTSSLEERLRKHNSHHKGFTGNANDWKIIYAEPYPTKELAYLREREIKKWKSKKRIMDLITDAGSEHPDL
ncbi:MAG: GIY-YIG nuclease family protein [Bacteroidales bacterium]|jgi:putative endonuclease|nr:GIY-YIG nuclease family protein [Bacteroidales bacterium]